MRARPLALAALALAGCAPILNGLQWPALPPYDPPELGTPPAGEVVPLLAGDPAPVDGLLIDPGYLAWLEGVALQAHPLTADALARAEAGRLDDRAWAGAEYDLAVRRLRGRLGPICALCASGGAVAGIGAASAACP